MSTVGDIMSILGGGGEGEFSTLRDIMSISRNTAINVGRS